MYIYISLTYLIIWHIPFWSIEFKKLHHWSHIIGSIMQFPLAFWHKIGEVFPLRCLFLMRHPPAGGICQEIARNSAFKLLDVGWPWMTLRFKHTPILEHTPPKKKKNEAPVYEGNSFHSVIVDFFHIWSMFQGTAAIFLGTCDKIVNVWSNMFAF